MPDTYSLDQNKVGQLDPRPFGAGVHNDPSVATKGVIAASVPEDANLDDLFPVVLLHSYRPLGAYHVAHTDQHLHGEPTPVAAGTVIHVPKDEAKSMIAAKVGARADTLE